MSRGVEGEGERILEDGSRLNLYATGYPQQGAADRGGKRVAGSVSVAGRDHDADGDESSAELAHRDVYHPVRFDLHQAPNLTLAEEGRKTSR